MKTLIEQYRCFEEDNQNNKPSVQLYAIYLEEAINGQNLPVFLEEINKEMEEGKKQIEVVKIGLEKEQNYSSNLEKMFMNLLN